ncbi:hypothetical protein QEV68_10655 [Trueperella pyogenes]|uniref:hypothetical protein n=1 Tax=Trueperella pyogenes TaxID=1661 RepID=UPI0032431842
MNPKILACSLEAIGLWTLAGAWACQQLTDGSIPKQMLQAFRSNASIASELVASGLWEETEDGYQFHDWAHYQYTQSEVEDRRAKRAEAGRKGGIKSGLARRSKREANASSKTKQTRSKYEAKMNPIPSHPIYTSTQDKSCVDGGVGEGANAPTPPKPKKKRPTKLPKTWTPNDTHAGIAMELGIHLGAEATKFRDHAKATGRTLIDWDAGFRNWLRQASEYQTRQPAIRQPALDPWTGGDTNGNPF